MELISPVLLSELLDKDLSGLTDDLSVMRGTILKQSLFKKYVPPGQNASLDAQAKESFLSWNSCVRNTGLCDDYQNDPFMRSWRDCIHWSFRDSESINFDYGEFLNRGYTGPGASIQSDKNDFLTKMFDSPLSTTSSFLYKFYTSAISEKWREAEEIRHSNHQLSIVAGSKLSTVPKDSKRNRTICSEPTLNMFYQLGAKSVLEDILRRDYSINMSAQPEVNKKLACLGSIAGEFSTLDLKNASDSLSMDLMRFLLPKFVFNKLCVMRSPTTFVDGVPHNLNMISTMGNGFTFPLMTLVFAALLRATYMELGYKFRNLYHIDRGHIFLTKDCTFAVFGDDIICRTEVYDFLVSKLEYAGFTVNLDKSFSAGFFRESCGGDFYRGHNVRGVYIKELSDETSIYTAINRLAKWSSVHRIPLVNTIRGLVRVVKFRPVPLHSNIQEGILLHSDHLLSPKRDRNGALFYRALRPVTSGWRLTDSYRNPVAAEISAIGGHVRGHFISSRPWKVKYKVVKLVTPCWDYWFDSDVLRREFRDTWSLILMRG